MSLRRTLAAALVAAAIVPAAAASALNDAESDTPPGNPRQAIYGDRIIDLSQGWDTAQACIELTVETRCYRTDEELRRAHPDYFADVEHAPRAVCGNSLALYDNTHHNTPVAYFTTRYVFHDLWLFSFDSKPSSYTIGGCSAAFFDGLSGAGNIYPGNTGAGASRTTMGTWSMVNWNNRVRSIYIY